MAGVSCGAAPGEGGDPPGRGAGKCPGRISLAGCVLLWQKSVKRLRVGWWFVLVRPALTRSDRSPPLFACPTSSLAERVSLDLNSVIKYKSSKII